MKNLFISKLLIISLIWTIIPSTSNSQSRKPKGPTIFVATTINYYPSIAPYSFFSSFIHAHNDLDLNFLTATSGTFTLEEGQSLSVMRNKTSDFPSQLLGIGASIQIKQQSSLFHEFSLTKLSIVKSSHIIEFTYRDSLDNLRSRYLGYKQNSSVFAFRYELGKYFGKNKSANVRIGISGGIEPSFYFYKRTPQTINEFPIKARLFTVEVSVIPMISAKLSKKLFMDFKIIPNILLGDFEDITENNPTVPTSEQNGIRSYSLPEINLAFSLLLRYTIKEPKRRGRS